MARGGKLKWKKWVKYKVQDYAQRGATLAMTQMYTRAQEIVPFDDGELTLGARVSSEGQQTTLFTVVLSYGNNNVSKEYALIQHENLSYNHTPPERAKYLQSAMEMTLPDILNIIKYTTREAL